MTSFLLTYSGLGLFMFYLMRYDFRHNNKLEKLHERIQIFHETALLSPFFSRATAVYLLFVLLTWGPMIFVVELWLLGRYSFLVWRNKQ